MLGTLGAPFQWAGGWIEQRAAEDGRAHDLGCGAADQGGDGGAPGIVTLVAARLGDAAAEEQSAVGGVEEDLSAGGGAKAAGLGAVGVSDHRHAGNGGGAVPEMGALPTFGNAGGPKHQDIGVDLFV